MLNYIWLGLIFIAVVIGGYLGSTNAVEPARVIQDISDGGINAAKTAVELSIALIGVMTLWLGVMRLAERAGLVQLLAKLLRPLMRWLFPDVPPDHPAMAAMVMNMAANMLGLGNAATPLGLRAMADLEKLNKHPGTATNAMCTFLAINTSSIQLVPATTVALLAAAGAVNPSAIIGTAFLATTASTIVGITSVKLLEKLPMFAIRPTADLASAGPQTEASSSENQPDEILSAPPPRNLNIWGRLLLSALAVFFVFVFAKITWPTQPLLPGETIVYLKSGDPVRGAIVERTAEAVTVRAKDGNLVRTDRADIVSTSDYQAPLVRAVGAISTLAIPLILLFFPLYAALRGVKVYEEFVEGAKEGFHVAVRIIPYLVTMLVAIGMFRGAKCMDLITELFAKPLAAIGFPPELLPLALMRPLSGSGSTALFADLIKEFGPDSLIVRTAGTIIGSTETTFYVIAIYFGSVAIRRTRHAIPAGLLADAAGVCASIAICKMMFA